MLSAILWDNDGALVDTERFYFAACRIVGFPAERLGESEAPLAGDGVSAAPA